MDNPDLPPEPPTDQPLKPSVPESPKSKLILFIVIIIIIIPILTVARGYYFAKITIKQKISPTPLPPTVTIAQPSLTPDPTANWKTYINTKFGYSFKYPSDIRIDACDAKFCHQATATDYLTIYAGKYLDITSSNTFGPCWGFKTEQEVISCLGNLGKDVNSRWIPVMIGGKSAVRKETTLVPPPPAGSDINTVGVILYVNGPSGNLQISFHDSTADRQTMDQILSTFKFLSNQFQITQNDNGKTFTYVPTSRFSVNLDPSQYPLVNLKCSPEGIIGKVSNLSRNGPGQYPVGYEAMQPGTCILKNNSFSITIIVAPGQ